MTCKQRNVIVLPREEVERALRHLKRGRKVLGAHHNGAQLVLGSLQRRIEREWLGGEQ
jgi:hypothetical protein